MNGTAEFARRGLVPRNLRSCSTPPMLPGSIPVAANWSLRPPT